MNTKVSVFVIYIEASISLLLCNLHECTFNGHIKMKKNVLFGVSNDFDRGSKTLQHPNYQLNYFPWHHKHHSN